jgi:hypothetical protein
MNFFGGCLLAGLKKYNSFKSWSSFCLHKKGKDSLSLELENALHLKIRAESVSNFVDIFIRALGNIKMKFFHIYIFHAARFLCFEVRFDVTLESRNFYEIATRT